MFISNVISRYIAVIICGMFLVTTPVLADEADKQLPKDKIEQEKLRKLMNFTLVGTVLSDAGKSVAIMEDNKTNEQKFYRMGGSIRGGRITKIQKDRVVITKDGVKIVLRLNGGTSRGGGVAMVEERYSDVDNNLEVASTKTDKVEKYDNGFPKIKREDLESIINAKEISLPVTMLDDGRLLIDDVQPDSLLAKLGLGIGDIIISYNTQPDVVVSSSEAFAQVLQQEFGEDLLRINVEHQDGKPDVLYIGIDDSTEEQGASE